MRSNSEGGRKEKVTMSEYDRMHYAAHKEEINVRKRARYAENRERERARSLNYYIQNREENGIPDTSEYDKSYHAANEKRIRARKKAARTRENQGERMRRLERMRECQYKKNYNITLADYDQMFAQQRGRCKICAKKEKRGRRLSVDHNHQTGRVRGLLCNRCNTGLGKFCDNSEILVKAAEYLMEYGP